jgi:DHA2 family multidrug resistance protein
MSRVALTPSAAGRTAIIPWLVAIAVVVPTFMKILDTTIATASLRYITGGLFGTFAFKLIDLTLPGSFRAL